MGGMKKRLTNPENARDPDSPINKALIELLKIKPKEQPKVETSHPLDGPTRVAQEKVENFSTKVSPSLPVVKNTPVVKASPAPVKQAPKKQAPRTPAAPKSPLKKSGPAKKRK